MSISENVKNAFSVVRNTYNSIDKMMEHCDSIAESKGYIPISDRFLRYKSDIETEGWLVNSFIKVYQRSIDLKVDNDWRKGPVFIIDINLYDSPLLNVAMFNYNDIESWQRRLLPSHHWRFYHPINSYKSDTSIEFGDEKFIIKSKNFSGEISEKYCGLRGVYYTSYDLTKITNENISKFIFKTFDQLISSNKSQI